MSADDDLMRSLAAAIADGSIIDWSDVEARMIGAGRADQLRRLRELAAMSEAFRSDRGDDTLPAAAEAPTPAQATRDLTLGGGRFQVTRRLGSGAFGVVYEAFDSARAATVAIKRVRAVDVASIYDVKKEFRVLADLMHPNLVTLYDLFADGDDWFIVMELVRGVDFLTYVRGDTTAVPAVAAHPLEQRTADWTLLERAVAQLVRAVCYLHEHGKLHRDLKPTNVLVTADGVLKVLDFGLTTEIVPDVMGDSFRIRGTPAYVAPEQAAGQPATEASDWYSVGVMVFEAITGERPFDGEFLHVLDVKQRQDARPLSALRRDVPEPLDALCRELLDRRPERRPGDAEIAARVARVWPASAAAARPRTASRRGAPFVGRAAQLAVLDAAFDAAVAGRAQMVFVKGSSGLGKTALIHRFLTGLRERHQDAVLLSGRCYERESVPYKALDSLMDRLSHYLRTLAPADVDALLPRDVPALTRLFPILQRVDQVAATRFRSPSGGNAHELRRRSFAAFRELLARLSDRRPTVLVVDDLHWGDSDSAALIDDLMFGDDPPPLLFVACYRFEEMFSSAPLRSLVFGERPAPPGCDVHEVEIAEFSVAESYQLASALTTLHGGTATDVASIVRESGGSPFFINELIQYSTEPEGAGAPGKIDAAVHQPSPLGLDAVIRARVRRLDDDARRLLQILAIFGGPLQLSVAVAAAGLREGGLHTVLLLRAAHLTRTRLADAGDEIEFYHDRIRETVAADLPTHEVPRLHARLAAVLQAAGHVAPETLLVHFRGAGELAPAHEQAVRAGDRARDAVAFDRAASYYRTALELSQADGARRHEIEVKLADALAAGGRGYEAAQAYFAAARGALAAEWIGLQRQAADQLLRSGHIDEGLDAIGRVLTALGMQLASSPLRALQSVLGRRLWLRLRGLHFQPRDRSQISEEQLVRIDACWTVATAIGVVDTICGADFQARHLILALDTGDPFRVARALALDSAYAALGGSRTMARQRALTEAAQQLAEEVGQREMMAYVTLAKGVGAFFQGDWIGAREHLQRAEPMLRECPTSIAWELDTTYFYHLLALFYLGEIDEVVRRLPGFLREARERDDLTAATNLRTRVGYVIHLAADRPEAAREEVQHGMQTWGRAAFQAQHSWEMYVVGEIHLYSGRGVEAWQWVTGKWPQLRRSLLLRIQAVRIESQYMLGRAALAASLDGRWSAPECRRLIKRAAGCARRLRRERARWAVPLAALLEAGVATTRGDAARAARDLERAEHGFDGVNMALHAAVARRRRGEILGGEPGVALADAANSWMKARGIVRPDGIVDMLAPGRFGR
jgi:eukaryotic-like serine/threonine-protein kinase